MRVAIVGAGIGGCALALSLEAAGITDIDIYEASPEPRELGVGINVLPHAARELTELGLAEEMDAIGLRTGGLSYHNRFGQQIWVEPRGLDAGYQWPQWSVHRGKMLGVLFRAVLQRVGEARVHLDHRVEPDRLDHIDADVVVAADGIHSALRTLVAPDEGAPLWNGVTMWRGTSVGEPFLGGRRMIMAGRLWERVVVYPIADLPDGRQLLNWVAEQRTDDGRPMPKQDWSAEADVAEPLAVFADYRFPWLDVPTMLGAAESVLRYPMADRDPLHTWRHGRMTLLGDAAHPMYPVGSNGSSQAILDARVLARHLALCETIDEALDAYEAERLPATAAVVLSNRKAGPERCMEIVADRAPNGFDDLDAVIGRDELEEIVTAYRRTAGFDPAVLNGRPSLSVR